MADQVILSSPLLDYVRDFSLREDDVLRELREETAELPGGTALQINPEEGQFLALLVRMTGAADVLELGTYTGYSALCMARAGVADRVEQRVEDAAAVLGELLAERGPASFDLVFIDADKVNYPRYYEQSLELVRPGGLIVVDNTLFFGQVADPAFTDANTEGVRALNALLRDDERVEVSMLTIADGVTLARRKGA
ncbi:O-methyltransferase [Streptomyces sp. NPDC127074]|uniref:O-methyltransferase n=1 Tax=Streptomyces sp. NPDC127074 TaxID=3347130 RepID=UPI00365110BD